MATGGDGERVGDVASRLVDCRHASPEVSSLEAVDLFLVAGIRDASHEGVYLERAFDAAI